MSIWAYGRFGAYGDWEAYPESECEICGELMTAESPYNSTYASLMQQHGWGNTYTIPSCKHVFHTACLLNWESKKGNANCPMCRAPFRMNQPPRTISFEPVVAIIERAAARIGNRSIMPMGEYVEYTMRHSSGLNDEPAVHARFYDDKVEVNLHQANDLPTVLQILYDVDYGWARDRVGTLPENSWHTIHFNNKLSQLYPDTYFSHPKSDVTMSCLFGPAGDKRRREDDTALHPAAKAGHITHEAHGHETTQALFRSAFESGKRAELMRLLSNYSPPMFYGLFRPNAPPGGCTSPTTSCPATHLTPFSKSSAYSFCYTRAGFRTLPTRRRTSGSCSATFTAGSSRTRTARRGLNRALSTPSCSSHKLSSCSHRAKAALPGRGA